ncbi:MAG: ankyrin repeat domain-containing protein, partial [Gammaproteobacteria bacterium]
MFASKPNSNSQFLPDSVITHIKNEISDICLIRKNTSDKGEKINEAPFIIKDANNIELEEALKNDQWNEAGRNFINYAWLAITESPLLNPENLLDLIKDSPLSENVNYFALALAKVWNSEDFTAAISLLLAVHYKNIVNNNSFDLVSDFMRNDYAPPAPLLLALMRLQLRLDSDGKAFFKNLNDFYKLAIQIIIHDVYLYISTEDYSINTSIPLSNESQTLLTFITLHYFYWLLKDTTLEKLPKFFKQICYCIDVVLSSSNLSKTQISEFIATYFNLRMQGFMLEEYLQELWPIALQGDPLTNKENRDTLAVRISNFVDKHEGLDGVLYFVISDSFFQDQITDGNREFINSFTTYYAKSIEKKKTPHLKKNKAAHKKIAQSPEILDENQKLNEWFQKISDNPDDIKNFYNKFVKHYENASIVQKIRDKFRFDNLHEHLASSIDVEKLTSLLANPEKARTFITSIRSYMQATFGSPIAGLLAMQNAQGTSQAQILKTKNSPKSQFEAKLLEFISKKPIDISQFFINLANAGRELPIDFQYISNTPSNYDPDEETNALSKMKFSVEEVKNMERVLAGYYYADIELCLRQKTLDNEEDIEKVSSHIFKLIYYAIQNNNIELFKAIFGMINDSYKNDDKKRTTFKAKLFDVTQNNLNLLCIATEYQNIEVVTQLISEGANPKQLPIDCVTTPLHIAVNHGNRKIIELLLRYDAEANMADQHGNTPFDYAWDRNDYDRSYITWLLSKGINQVNISSALSAQPNT